MSLGLSPLTHRHILTLLEAVLKPDGCHWEVWPLVSTVPPSLLNDEDLPVSGADSEEECVAPPGKQQRKR